jgi:multisubunit Na+/H+ antiporter MnhE subunit
MRAIGYRNASRLVFAGVAAVAMAAACWLVLTEEFGSAAFFAVLAIAAVVCLTADRRIGRRNH